MLPTPVFSSPAEPFLSADESICDPVERPGVHLFIDFVLKQQGGKRGRTLGPCDHTSGHASGRAWDWMISADVPEERARADELLGWLLANDAEIFRRAGLGYIIWDRRIWSALYGRWKPYDGYDEAGGCPGGSCRSAHRDHVHFSFNALGADGKTSFYDWLESDRLTAPPATPTLPPLATATTSWGPMLAGFSVGFIALAFASRTKLWRRIVVR